jgi:cytochrome c551/c552
MINVIDRQNMTFTLQFPLLRDGLNLPYCCNLDIDTAYLRGKFWMKKMKIVLLAASTAVLSLGAATNAVAEDASALAQKSGCLACHQLEVKVVGPAYKDVAAKYKGQDVLEQLVTKVKAGGVGTWGEIPMPPNVNVSEADVRTIVTWILSL